MHVRPGPGIFSSETLGTLIIMTGLLLLLLPVHARGGSLLGPHPVAAPSALVGHGGATAGAIRQRHGGMASWQWRCTHVGGTGSGPKQGLREASAGVHHVGWGSRVRTAAAHTCSQGVSRLARQPVVYRGRGIVAFGAIPLSAWRRGDGHYAETSLT